VLLGLVAPRHVSFVAMAELFKYWPIRKFLLWQGHMAIDRNNAAASGELMLAQATQTLRNGGAVTIYPEGGMSKNPLKLRPLKTGPMRLAHDTGDPVIPVGTAGINEVLPYSGGWPRRGKTVVIRLGAPLHLHRVVTPGEAQRAAIKQATDRLAVAIQTEVDLAVATLATLRRPHRHTAEVPAFEISER
jgi:1-acyl-sn-glycerol-3-phosphate acyltransferase